MTKIPESFACFRPQESSKSKAPPCRGKLSGSGARAGTLKIHFFLDLSCGFHLNHLEYHKDRLYRYHRNHYSSHQHERHHHHQLDHPSKTELRPTSRRRLHVMTFASVTVNEDLSNGSDDVGVVATVLMIPLIR